MFITLRKNMALRIKKRRNEILFDKFNYYDVDKVYKINNPKVLGGQYASNHQVENEEQRTSDEDSYLREINAYIKKLNEYGATKAQEIKQEVISVLQEIDNSTNNFTKLERFYKENVMVIKDAFIHEEERSQEQRVDLRAELNNFRLINKLSKREAYYPKSYILHFAWIFVFIFLEALINSYFFGEASSLGLLGGVFIGFVTSFFNVVLSTMAGFILRYKNHVSLLKKFTGLTIFTLFLVAIFAIHLFIAHYREILATNAHVDIWSVLKPTIEQPFALHDMESLILISIGLLITLFSILKGMSLDDEYPGYSRVYRRWKEKEEEFLKSKKQARSLMRNLHSTTLNKSDGMLKTLEKSRKKLESLNSDLDDFINTYRGYHIRAVEGARQILSDYRAGVRFVLNDKNSFEYHDRLIVGEGGLKKIDLVMLLESKHLIEEELKNINQYIIDFYNNQKSFEENLEKMKDSFLDDESIDKILQQVKKSREVEL